MAYTNSKKGLAIVHQWMDLIAEGEYDEAMALLVPKLGPWESGTSEQLLKWIHWWVEPRADFDPTYDDDDIPEDWLGRALHPEQPPFTRRSELPEPVEGIDYCTNDASGTSGDPSWFAVDHSLPIDGEWSDVFAFFEGTVADGVVKVVLIHLKVP